MRMPTLHIGMEYWNILMYIEDELGRVKQIQGYTLCISHPCDMLFSQSEHRRGGKEKV